MTGPLADSATSRDRADACPGLLRPHLAADGGLVRVRLPGGRLSVAQLTALMHAADRFGDGRLQLTSRGNVQLRGIRVSGAGEIDPELVVVISRAGLLPSPTHERVRNLLCSPLTGLSGGLADLRPALGALDRMLCAAPELAGLPGRILFGLDDGRGDIAPLGVDLGAVAVSADRAVLLAGDFLGGQVPVAEVPAALIGLARNFLGRAGGRWRVTEMADRGACLLQRSQPLPPRRREPLSPGVIRQRDGRTAMLLGAPLGLVDRRQIDALVATGTRLVVITPERSVLLTDLVEVPDPGMLTAAGWLTAADSSWAGISACVGWPGCAKSNGDTRSAAAAVAGRGAGSSQRVHISGCERRCGAPRGPHREVLLTAKGPVGREVTG